MPEEKKPRLLEDPGDWWKVSRYVPEGKQDLVLLVLGGAAAFFLLLTVIAFTELTGAGGENEEAKGFIGELQGKVEKAREEAEERKKSAEAARAKAADLGGRLAEAEKKLGQASGRGERLDALARAKDARIDELDSEIARMKRRLAEAAKFKAQAQRLEAKLTKTDAELVAFRDESAGVLGEKAGLEDVLKNKTARYDTLVEKLSTRLLEREQDVLALAARNEEVEAELREFPVEPLSDEGAARKYRRIMDEVADHRDRDRRIAILFRAKLFLAGTSYEIKADRKWRNERAQKQADMDRKARAVYEEAMSKIQSHRASHDQNVAILTAVLERVRGSKKYEAMVQREIDRQHEEKARVGGE